MPEQTAIFYDEAQRHDDALAELRRKFKAGGPDFPPTLEQLQIAEALRFHKGAGNAVKIRDLTALTRLTDRAVKDAVNHLRMDFGLLIGSSKSARDGGYYLILTDEERRSSAALPADEIRSRVKWLRLLLGEDYVGRLLGQLQLDLHELKEAS